MNDDLLIQRYLDGRLTRNELETLQHRLREDEAMREHLRTIAEQVVAFGDLARREPGAPVHAPALKADKNIRLVAIAAALALLAVTAWVFLSARETSVLTLVDASGSVAWSHGAEWRMDVVVGQKLAAGTVETVGESATALLQFRDGTFLTLSGDSELSFSEDGQKLLLLRKGSLAAQVKPQPQDKPMLVRTVSAEAQVVGTVFNLSARTDDTLLKVDEGLVKLKRLADGSTVDVPAKSSAVASLDSGMKLNSAATPEPLTDWSFDFTTTVPPRDWRGVWQDTASGGLMVSSPYIASRRPEHSMITHFGVSVRTAMLNPPLTLVATERSVMKYRLKQVQPSPLQVMLLTHVSKGSYGGNFECVFAADELKPDAEGWCDIEIPISRFKSVDQRQHFRDRHPSPVGNILTSVLLSSFQKDTKLTVARFELQAEKKERGTKR